MNKAEAIRLIKDHIRVHRIGVYPHIKIAEALEIAISALETDNNDGCKWIPVTEQLPEKGVRVLVWLSVKNYDQTNMDTDRLLGDRFVRCGDKVTHWMPLPDAPKDGDT